VLIQILPKVTDMTIYLDLFAKLIQILENAISDPNKKASAEWDLTKLFQRNLAFF
jgi:hypothetical protein